MAYPASAPDHVSNHSLVDATTVYQASVHNPVLVTVDALVTKVGIDGSGIGIEQVVNTTSSAVATGTTTIPKDDTIPQKTEGDEYMTLAITPVDTANVLYIEAIVQVSPNVSTAITVALFQDSTADALAAVIQTIQVAWLAPMTLRWRMAAGTTSSTTFKIRAGGTDGTLTFNGASGGRLFGGVAASSIRIIEVRE